MSTLIVILYLGKLPRYIFEPTISTINITNYITYIYTYFFNHKVNFNSNINLEQIIKIFFLI